MPPQQVSIHSLHLRREKSLPNIFKQRNFDVSIHSLHLRREKSESTILLGEPLTGFNPLSSFTKREISRALFDLFKDRSFNPLSSFTKREIMFQKKLQRFLMMFQSTLFIYEERNDPCYMQVQIEDDVSIHSLHLRREKC